MDGTSKFQSGERYVFIDALRGLACLGVLLHHVFFNTVMIEPLRVVFPQFVTEIMHRGSHGVQVFFVLSGFVIAHSLRSTPLTLQGVGRFILRRQIRLDPPYWAAMLLALGLHTAALIIVPATVSPFPSLREIALNFVYLQNILGVEQILIVAWTLCIEIQFYIVFILLLALAAKIAAVSAPATLTDAAVRRKAVLLLTASGVLSLLVLRLSNPHAWFAPHWFHFAAGVLCYWSVRDEMDQRILFGFLVAYVGAMIAAWQAASGDVFSTMLVGLITVGVIYLVGKRGRLTTLWNGPVIQYLGHISYSLYLVHWLVVVIVFRIGTKLTGQNPAFALFYVALAISLSIGAAHLFFLAVEKPSMRWAARLKNQPSPIQIAPPIAAATSGFATETESAA